MKVLGIFSGGQFQDNFDRQELSPSLRNFYFGSAIRHESKFVHMYTSCQEGETLTLKPTPVSHSGELD